MIVAPAALLAAGCEAAPSSATWTMGQEAFVCAVGAKRVGFSGRGPGASFKVEIADDPAEQEKGLMHRPSLAPDAGMLFLFKPPRVTQFWMKNTLIPLDMIFMDASGRVTFIEHKAQPLTLTSRGPESLTAAVLEVAGGRAAAVGVKLGDVLACPAATR